jgi:SagB-type dehydrogenase family enzyme
MRRFIWLSMFVLGIMSTAMAASAEMLPLPPPITEGGMPLMQALKERHSTREFSNKALPMQLLSDLLWAANGVNRPESGKRTAPTARDMREIQVYVTLANGTYLFDPVAHSLKRVSERDLRGLAGTQDFVAQAPLNLVYVSDTSLMDSDDENKHFYSATDTGFIAQNVYLFCASTGLATVVRGSIDRKVLAVALKLSPHQQIILAQTVGYPR